MTMFTFFTTVCRHKLSICFHTRVCFAKLRQIPDNMIFICIQNLRICIMQQKSTAQAVLHVELEALAPILSQNVIQAQMPIDNQFVTIIIKFKYF